MTDAPMDHTTGASLRGVTVTTRILCGDSREMLATLPDGSVQTCVTSPPYFGLRDYGHAGQIGLEATVDEYVTALVDVFREVRRVLKDDGTCWVNLGDSYNAYNGNRGPAQGANKNHHAVMPRYESGHGLTTPDLKPKDLIGIPWRVAFALQADGWYLRQDIIWSKPNPMPESVRDRCTKSHEYIFLLSKQPRYFYDAAAIREPNEPHGASDDGMIRHHTERPNNGATGTKGGYRMGSVENGRNKRSVWTVTTQPFSEAHFATFPPKLIEPCILAGSLPRGSYEPDDMILTPTGEGERGDDPSLVTGRAGMNRPRRAVEAVRPMSRAEQAAYAEQLRFSPYREDMEAQTLPTTFAHYLRTDASGARPIPPNLLEEWIDRGWLDRVSIPPRIADPSRSTVLDPFGGAGTTGLVADRLGRDSILIELNPEYAEIARRRITNDAPMFSSVEIA